MLLQKILYKLSFLLGLLLLLVGLIMKFLSLSSSGLVFSKQGNISHGTLDGNGTLVLSVMIFAFAIWNYKSYLEDKKEKDLLRKKEKNELLLRQKKNKGSS
ncbi:hypothetical protein FNW07_13450 [Flavobacterium sp. GT3R68]|nr:hypothetical protein FNW07_13450 [Flavobacterium sp. GT3R68]